MTKEEQTMLIIRLDTVIEALYKAKTIAEKIDDDNDELSALIWHLTYDTQILLNRIKRESI